MRCCLATLWVLCALGCAVAEAPGPELPHAVDAPRRAVTVEQYGEHLEELRTLVEECSVHPSASACDSARVGPDDEVGLPAGPRRVGYDWLRRVLDNSFPMKAGETAHARAALLSAAATRLADDTAPPARSADSPDAVRRHARNQLTSVLQQKQFQHLHTDNSWMDKVKQALWQWIFNRIAGLGRLSGRAQWLGEALLWAIVVLPCAFLLRWAWLQSRDGRAEMPPGGALDQASPSAREWQIWLAEAEHFAQQEQWREAVHHVYWAAISRMEARGLWPADRARTPREYVRLLPSGNVLLPDLRALTGAFERIWYGRRDASEREYRHARSLMERLVPR